jgi:molybdopterin molybdotransferase
MVYDSNRYALLAAVAEAGAEALSLGIVADEEQAQREALLHGLAQADVLVTSGGVSMGTRDLIKPLLAELGTIHFGRVATKPGKPTTFATVHNKLVFGMPGFPVSSLVAFEVYVRPALRRLQGDNRPDRPHMQVVLADSVRASYGRTDYQRAVVRWQSGKLIAHSTGAQSSSRLLSLRGANALLIVPPDQQEHTPGTELDALLIGPLTE